MMEVMEILGLFALALIGVGVYLAAKFADIFYMEDGNNDERR